MRLLGHNGEINTLVGNINWMRARAASQEAGCVFLRRVAVGVAP